MAAANIIPTAPTDGVVYANAVPLTANEAVLGDGAYTPVLIPTSFGAAIVAVVRLSISGFITANSTYVVMQMDVGDGVWIDINWLFWNQVQGTATFVFSNGVAGANTLQQTRNSGQVPNPQASGSNQMVLGGRIRFVGRSSPSGGSSAAAGVTTQVTATITYKMLGLQ